MVAGLGAVLLYGSVAGMSLAVGGEPLPESHERDHTTMGAALSSKPAMPMGGARISEEERERRVQVCERQFEACRDQCARFKQGAPCYRKCSDKLAECMKDIPYAE